MKRMKKILVIAAALVFSLTACADRHQLIAYNELPAIAQTFIKNFFNPSDIAFIACEKEGLHNEYNVRLNDNSELEFDHQGNVEKVDCKNSALPEGIVPSTIVQYVTSYFPNQFIVEYQIDHRRMQVELNNSIELTFDHNGNLREFDD